MLLLLLPQVMVAMTPLGDEESLLVLVRRSNKRLLKMPIDALFFVDATRSSLDWGRELVLGT